MGNHRMFGSLIEVRVLDGIVKSGFELFMVYY